MGLVHFFRHRRWRCMVCVQRGPDAANINEELPLFSCLLTISDPEIDSFLSQWGQGGTMLEFIGADFSEIDIEASGIQLINPSVEPVDSSDTEDDNPPQSVSCQLWMDSTYTNDEGNSTLTMWASSDSSLTGLQGSISYDAPCHSIQLPKQHKANRLLVQVHLPIRNQLRTGKWLHQWLRQSWVKAKHL